MTEQTTDVATLLPSWSGFHHIALVTRDLDATMRFYREVLGMQVTFIGPAGELHGRHCAIRPGGDPNRLGLLFLSILRLPYSVQKIERSKPLFLIQEQPFSHISFALPDEAAGLALQERLTHHNVVMSPIMDQGGIWNMAFLDNNGLPLEAAWPKQATS